MPHLKMAFTNSTTSKVFGFSDSDVENLQVLRFTVTDEAAVAEAKALGMEAETPLQRGIRLHDAGSQPA